MKLPAITSARVIAEQEGPPCEGDVYAPFYFQEPEPVVSGYQELLLTQGDPIIRLCYPPADPRVPLCDRNRGSDRIRLFVRPPAFDWRPAPIRAGNHDERNILFTNHSAFPWMGDPFYGDRLLGDIGGTSFIGAETYLRDRLGEYIGATASPSMVKVGNTYLRFFTATVGDSGFDPARISDPAYVTQRAFNASGAFRNTVTTARQFCLFSSEAVSQFDNGELRNFKRSHSNRAIQNALLWFGTITPAEKYAGEQGITGACAYLDDDGTIYLLINVWAPGIQKNGMARTNAAGDLLQLWNDMAWVDIVNGELPEWFLSTGAGGLFPHIANWIGRAPFNSGRKYMLLAPGAGSSFGLTGRDNCIEYAFSDDMTNWTEPEMVPSTVAGLFDGTAYDYQVRNPIWTGERYILTTNDLGVIQRDAKKHGTPGCTDYFGGLRVVETEVMP